MSGELKKIIKEDSILGALNAGNLNWGNIMANNGALAKTMKNNFAKLKMSNNTGGNNTRKANNKAKKANNTRNNKGNRGSKNSNKYIYEQNEDMLNGWNVPDLSLRKNIWETFPVQLNAIETRNGIERYEIVWHNKHLQEWQSRAMSEGESLEYKRYAEYRLLHALRLHGHKYKLEEPERKNQIVIIAMVPGPRALAGAGGGGAGAGAGGGAGGGGRAPIKANAFAGPKLVKLNDIKEYFPVVWKAVQGRPGKSTYALELFGKKIKEMSMAIGHDVTNEVKGRLMAALRASTSWNVLPSVDRELCRLEMR